MKAGCVTRGRWRPWLMAAAMGVSAGTSPAQAERCERPVYLTLDTGDMRAAEQIAGILARHRVRATFFLANEKTIRGDHALDDGWASYWRARVAEGHAFGSHTFDHVYLLRARGGRLDVRPQFGADAGRVLHWDEAALCRELRRVDERFRALTGKALDPLWRAPGGRAPVEAMQAAGRCGYRHVHWAAAGFLGDELPSDRFPNVRLLEQALAGIRPGDVLMMHLGIRSRADPFAPMLEPLISGLEARGFCFETLHRSPRVASGVRPSPLRS